MDCITWIIHQQLWKKKPPWSESASELYRPSDRRLSVKWLPTFADRGCHMVSVTDPSGRTTRPQRRSRQKSKSHYDRRSVSQSVCLGVKSNLGLLTSDFFSSKLRSCLCRAPSLTRGRVSHLSFFVNIVYSSQSAFTLIIHIKDIHSALHTFQWFTLYTGLVQSRFSTADYALLTSSLLYKRQFRHLNSRTNDRRQV
jgi:hypothetical protein